MTDAITIPGANELAGKGVYRGLPNDIPQPFVTGTPSSSASRLNAQQRQDSFAKPGGK